MFSPDCPYVIVISGELTVVPLEYRGYEIVIVPVPVIVAPFTIGAAFGLSVVACGTFTETFTGCAIAGGSLVVVSGSCDASKIEIFNVVVFRIAVIS